MDEFKVKLQQMQSVVTQQKNMSRELTSIRNDLSRVKNSLRFKIAQRSRIDTRLRDAERLIEKHEQQMEQLSGKLSDIQQLYERTERGLCGKNGLEFAQIELANIWGPNEGPFAILGPGGRPDKDFNFMENGEGELTTPWLNDLNDKLDEKTEPYNKKPGYKTVYDTETGTWKKVDPDDTAANKAFDDEMDRQEMDVSIRLYNKRFFGDEDSIYKLGGDPFGDKDGTHANAELNIGKWEYNGDAYAGLYQTDPTTGEMRFSPGIGAEIGGSFSALTAKETAQLGSDMMGVYVESTQTIGRVAGEAGAKVGFTDKDGNFNPAFYAGASAEAILAEATLAGGVKLAGTDIKAKGSVNFGVGAHAKAGFKDGKFSLDIGASLGVGASVNLEIDVSGTVNAIADSVSSAWDWLGNTFWGK